MAPTPLYQLLTQKDDSLLIVSDAGADEDKDYGSFGWVLGTDQEILWGCRGIARGYPMHSYRTEWYGRISLLLFPTHYLQYLEVQ
jgi:hypothetical protein